MTITQFIRQGLHYARTCKSLWLFGFVVGMASGGSSGGGSGSGGGGGAASVGVGLFGYSSPEIGALIIVIVLLAVAAAVVMRFVSEGALIEGVVRARDGGQMTTREGFGAGWTHWGVLLRIFLIYAAATGGSLVLLAAPCVIAGRALGWVAAVAVGLPALLIAVPWLVTLYLIQAFAARIAVLENRRALDAMAKSRLFLHGRIMHGLKLIVASLAGTLIIGFLGLAVLVPVGLSLALLIRVWNIVPVIVIGCAVLLPALFVLTAMIGTLRSSIWTIGYVTQAEA